MNTRKRRNRDKAQPVVARKGRSDSLAPCLQDSNKVPARKVVRRANLEADRIGAAEGRRLLLAAAKKVAPEIMRMLELDDLAFVDRAIRLLMRPQGALYRRKNRRTLANTIRLGSISRKLTEELLKLT